MLLVIPLIFLIVSNFVVTFMMPGFLQSVGSVEHESMINVGLSK